MIGYYLYNINNLKNYYVQTFTFSSNSGRLLMSDTKILIFLDRDTCTKNRDIINNTVPPNERVAIREIEINPKN